MLAIRVLLKNEEVLIKVTWCQEERHPALYCPAADQQDCGIPSTDSPIPPFPNLKPVFVIGVASVAGHVVENKCSNQHDGDS